MNIQEVITSLGGDIKSAKDYFESLQKQGGDKAWLAVYRLIQIDELASDSNLQNVTNRYLALYDQSPHRAEPLYQLAHLHRKKHDFSIAQLYAEQAMAIELPENGSLSKEKAIYDYQSAVEYATCSYYLGEHERAIMGANQAIRSSYIPIDLRNQIVDNRRCSLDQLFPSVAQPEKKQNSIKVIACFRNAGDYVLDSVRSLQAQKYANFEVFYVDDASDDGSHKHVPVDDDRFHLIRNKTRKGALFGQIKTALDRCGKDDIVVRLDGDDSFIDEHCLRYINHLYCQHDCWVMYGQFQFSDGRQGTALPVIKNEGLKDPGSLMALGFPLHPITYRVALLRAMQRRDPDLSCFKDKKNKWYMASTDLAQAVCLMQSAGVARIRYNDKLLYRYNIKHSNLTRHSHADLQRKVGLEVCVQRPMSIISDQAFCNEI